MFNLIGTTLFFRQNGFFWWAQLPKKTLKTDPFFLILKFFFSQPFFS